MLYEGETENFFMLMVEPPQRVRPDMVPPSEFIFLVDVSSSMNGFPLDTAKYLLKNLLGRLRAQDRFNVILFAGGSRVMAPASVPATAGNMEKAVRLIDAEQGGGGTELLRALKRAMALPCAENYARSVLLITDGYIAAERDVFEHIRQNRDRSNVFSFGIGSGVNRYLIEGVASAGHGEPFVVTDASKARETAGRFIQYVQQPVLSRIEVATEGFDAQDLEPLVIPDLFARRPLVILGKWRGQARGNIVVKGIGADGLFEHAVRVTPSASGEKHRVLPYLWARQRLLQLSDYAGNRRNDVNKDQITALGLNYNLATAFTSFIAVLEKPRLPRGAEHDAAQPLPLPRGVSNLAVGGPMSIGSEPGLILILAATAASAFLIGRRRKHNRMLK